MPAKEKPLAKMKEKLDAEPDSALNRRLNRAFDFFSIQRLDASAENRSCHDRDPLRIRNLNLRLWESVKDLQSG